MPGICGPNGNCLAARISQLEALLSLRLGNVRRAECLARKSSLEIYAALVPLKFSVKLHFGALETFC